MALYIVDVAVVGGVVGGVVWTQFLSHAGFRTSDISHSPTVDGVS